MKGRCLSNVNANDKEKLTRILSRIERRVAGNRAEASKMKGSPENAQYFFGARDEAQKILEMLRIEFNNELRIVNVPTKGDGL